MGKRQRALQPLRDGIAAVPQDPRTLFAADTVCVDLASLGRDAALVDTVVRQMALAPLLDRHPFDLSGGEQQRCAGEGAAHAAARAAARRADERAWMAHSKADFARFFARALRTGRGRVHREPRCGVLRAVRRPLRPAFFRGEVVTENAARVFLRQLFLHHGGRAHRAHSLRQARYCAGRSCNVSPIDAAHLGRARHPARGDPGADGGVRMRVGRAEILPHVAAAPWG